MKDNWSTIRISDFGRVVTGKTPSTKRPELFGEKYPFITPTDLEYGTPIANAERAISEEGYLGQRNLLLPPNTVCFTCIGATIGKMCITKQPSFTNQQINSIIVNSDEHDYWFVYYLLRTQIEKIKGRAGGAATPIVNKTAFSNVEVVVPLLPIQRKIAAILSAYDDLIENNTRRIAILEEMAQRIYKEWFVDFRYPGHENQKLVESEVGMIPEGWEVMSLGDFAREVRRSVDPKELDPSTPHFGLEHLPKRSIALSNWGYANEVQSTKLGFKKGEILFGKIRPYFHKVGVAPLDGICSTDTIVIVSKEPRYYFLVLGCVSSTEFVNNATQTSQGTKMPRANWNVLVKYPLVSPVEAVLSDFNELMKAIIDQLINCIFRNRNLRQSRDLLLPKLISGKIKLNELGG